MYNELRHTGVIGMKWGIRRYQNEDGTLTEEGKRRKRHAEKRAKQKSDSRNVGSLTTVEIQEKIQRLQLEKQLRELTDEQIYPGKVYAERILKDVGTRVLSTVLVGAAMYGAKAIASKSFDRKELGNAIFNGGKKK